MAKTYLDVNPRSNVVIFDEQGSIGGVWAKHRLYPGLNSNNLAGSFEYSDFPMDEKTFGVKPAEHIPGPVVHQYLYTYAEKFDLLRRIQFNRKVKSVERKDDGRWIVRSSQRKETIVNDTTWTHKLVIATGLTSEPFIPAFIGSESFNAPIFHAKDLLTYAETTIKSAKNVVVFGSSKSAYDAAYAHASAGVSVDWVIRESGNGPVWMAPIYVTPLKKRLDTLIGVRFLTWFSPCIWGDNDSFARVRKYLHNTKVGRWFVDSFWDILANDLLTLNGYDKHPETAKLKPWAPAFWIGSTLSVLNYPTDIFQYVRDGTIKIHIADITNLSHKTVHLSDNTAIQGDALICSTGWEHRPSINFLPEGLDERLGLPYSSKFPEDVLVDKADNEILARFPRLASQPVRDDKYKPLKCDESAKVHNRPYRLYRFMVPAAYINDRSIGFAGMIMSVHTTTCAQAQALWLTAYFSGGLQQDVQQPQFPLEKPIQTSQVTPFNDKAVQWQTVLQSQFGKWRYPTGYGKRYPDFAFDAVPYMDMLLRDLGLKFLRKGWWWREWFEPYGPGDYRGLVNEWKAKVSLLEESCELYTEVMS